MSLHLISSKINDDLAEMTINQGFKFIAEAE